MRFTVRRLPTGEVSPCCHRPSGGDVACGVDVGVAPSGIAGFTLENRLALAVSGGNMPASGASLRRIRGRDLVDPAASFVLQPCAEKPPAAAADGSVQPPFLRHTHAGLLDSSACRAGHLSYVKILYFYQVEPSRQHGARLLGPVFAPIPLARLQFRDRTSCSFAAVGPALAAGEALLQDPQPPQLTRGKARYVQQFACRQRSRHGNTPVDPDDAAIAWTADWIRDVRERHMPAACPIFSYAVRPSRLWHRTRQPESHPSDLGNPNPAEVAVQPLDMTRLKPDLPEPFMHARLAPCRASVRTSEEVLHGLREVPERLLLHRLTASPKPFILGTGLRQLRGLLSVAGSLPAGLPVLLLLDRQVPHIPSISAVRRQDLLLLGCRHEAEPRHNRTVIITTDISDDRIPATLGIGSIPGSLSPVSNRGRLK